MSSTGETVCLDRGHERAAPTLLSLKRTEVLEYLLVSLRGPSPAMCCRPSSATGDKALVLGVRDCTLVGGGTSLLKTQPPPVRELSGR